MQQSVFEGRCPGCNALFKIASTCYNISSYQGLPTTLRLGDVVPDLASEQYRHRNTSQYHMTLNNITPHNGYAIRLRGRCQTCYVYPIAVIEHNTLRAYITGTKYHEDEDEEFCCDRKIFNIDDFGGYFTPVDDMPINIFHAKANVTLVLRELKLRRLKQSRKYFNKHKMSLLQQSPRT